MNTSGPAGPQAEWDAEAYGALAGPQRRWAEGLLGRAGLRGDETVLDAGCGDGGVTEELVRRLPRGRVVAVDASRAMVAAAARRLARRGDRVRVVHSDLTALPATGDFDVVFSNAVFHHVPDHDALFSALHGVLGPGGRLVAQCGGTGNLEAVRGHIARVAARDPRLAALRGWPGTSHPASPEGTVAALRRAGFAYARAWCTPAPVAIDDPGRLRRHLEVITLRGHLARLGDDAGARRALLDGVAAECLRHPPALDHVRLDIEAVRGA